MSVSRFNAPNETGSLASLDSLAGVLDQLADLIESMGAAEYTSSLPPVFESSIGSQVRHSLDHVRAFLDGVSSGRLNYDHRERGTPIEQSPARAVTEIASLMRGIRAI